MNDTDHPTTSSPADRRQTVHAQFTVDTPSGAHANSTVRYLLRALIEGRERHADLDELRSYVSGWWLTDGTQLQPWEPFEDTGIPEMVAEMFPPEPDRDNFRDRDGSIDEEAFEDAHADWRQECLTLAVQASRLPALLARLKEAERVNDAVAGALARHPLPARPTIPESPSWILTDQGEKQAVSVEYARWQRDFEDAAWARETALRTALAQGNVGTRSVPEQVDRDWAPRALIATSTLRALLAADPTTETTILDRGTRERLEALLAADNPDVRVPDSDDPDGPELYEGPANEAHRWLPAGVFAATGIEGQGTFRVVVGRTRLGTGGTASAAFPPPEHDSTVMNEISHVLETASPDTSAEAVLDRVNRLVASTGREGRESAPTLLEHGALLSELLAERDRTLGHPQHRSGTQSRGDDRDLGH